MDSGESDVVPGEVGVGVGVGVGVVASCFRFEVQRCGGVWFGVVIWYGMVMGWGVQYVVVLLG